MLCASEIIEKYLQGASLASLGREYNCDSLKIRKLLCDNGIQIRSQKEQNKYSPQNQRKYIINDNYLNYIDSSDKAYFLGFFAADGTVRKDGSCKIGLSSVDRSLLEQFQKALETNYPIRDYMTKDGFAVSEFCFRSSKIIQEFSKYGIINNKTYSLRFPKNIPSEYIIDYIRGFWDGDGTICKSGNYARASLCGYNKEFLEDVLNILEQNYGIPRVNILQVKDKHAYYFQYASHAVEKLYYCFYKNKDSNQLYLNRKYLKFKELFGEINSHEPATSQAEEKIV